MFQDDTWHLRKKRLVIKPNCQRISKKLFESKKHPRNKLVFHTPPPIPLGKTNFCGFIFRHDQYTTFKYKKRVASAQCYLVWTLVATILLVTTLESITVSGLCTLIVSEVRCWLDTSECTNWIARNSGEKCRRRRLKP